MVWTIFRIYIILIVLAVVCYIPKLRQFFFAKKTLPHKTATNKRKIAVVVPARKEFKTIPSLLDSIKKQDYDKDFFDVNIIVKDPDDPTISLAKEIGANVFVVTNQTCKGEALDGYFKSLSPKKLKSYDAFVIVDADAVLTDQYLTELNNALEYDKQIFVTRKLVKNFLLDENARSLSCNCSALTYPVVDDLGNAYRTQKNIPLNFCGQGLMVRREIIEKLGGWPYRSLTEDYELKMDGYLKDFTSMYYPYAVIYTEEAISHKEIYKRRVRWLNGVSQCDKQYKKSVKQKIKSTKASNSLKFDYLYYHIGILLFLVATILAVVLGQVIIFNCHLSSEVGKQAYWLLTFFPLMLMYVVLVGYTIIAMICYKDGIKNLSRKEKTSMMLFGPFFWLEYVPIYIQSKLLLQKNLNWSQTERINDTRGTYEEESENL